MKILRKFVALPVMMLLLICASQASADSLGDKLADQLCYNVNTNSYTLSVTELAQWSGQEVKGEKAEYKGSDKYIATFYKSSGKDSNATCKKKTIILGNITCLQSGVTKSGQTLIKSSSASKCQ